MPRFKGRNSTNQILQGVESLVRLEDALPELSPLYLARPEVQSTGGTPSSS